MYAKKIKRKCGVRGCKNTDTYAISKTREMGNSIIACKECLLEALNTLEEQNKSITFEEAPAIEEAPAEEQPIVFEEAKPVSASLTKASKLYDTELIKDATETLVEELEESATENKPKTRQRKK